MTLTVEPASFGIVCLTPENLGREWLLFEAGAIGMKFGRARVCPYLLGLKATDVQPPLSMFQSVEATKEGTLALAKSLNEYLADQKLSESSLQKTVEVWWPRLEEELKKIPDAPGAKPKPRTERELLEEILAIVRSSRRDDVSPARSRLAQVLAELERGGSVAATTDSVRVELTRNSQSFEEALLAADEAKAVARDGGKDSGRDAPADPVPRSKSSN